MATRGSNGGRPNNNNRGKNQQMGIQGPRKRPWTPEEDAILKDYVTKNGAGNWNVLRRICGLNRCNKSCRLRWINHLRPNLKKGAFNAEEEAIIVYFHHKLGNKWSSIASQLPGRTDNEVKNFWHTRRKKRERANLPLYPTPSEIEEIENLKQSTPKISNNPSPSSLQSPCMTTFIHPPIYEKFYNMSYVPTNNSNQIYTVYPQNNNNNNNNNNMNYAHQNYSVFPQNDNNNASGFTGQLNAGFINYPNSSSTFNLDSIPNPALFGSQQNYHQLVYTTPSQVDIFNQHSNGNDGLLEDIVINHAKILNEKSMKNIEVNQSQGQEFLWDYKVDNEGPITLQDQSLYGGQNFMEANNFHESSSSLSAIVNQGNFPVIGGPMPDWYNDRAGPVATVQSSTSFNGSHQTAMPNWQELFNSSDSMPMETSTMAFNGVQTPLMPNRQELFNTSNLMAMATSQPFMDNSGHLNIMPGVHQAFNGNGNSSEIQ